MFNRILGVLSGRSVDSLFVLTGGIEWDIAVPTRAVNLFGPLGERTEVFVWLHHYEDGMKLFGFPSDHERRVFLDLMKVEGIGPKQALKILSGISPADLTAALDAGNLAALQKISGVGPKMAQKMVLALKGRLVELSAGGDVAPHPRPGATSSPPSLIWVSTERRWKLRCGAMRGRSPPAPMVRPRASLKANGNSSGLSFSIFRPEAQNEKTGQSLRFHAHPHLQPRIGQEDGTHGSLLRPRRG